MQAEKILSILVAPPERADARLSLGPATLQQLTGRAIIKSLVSSGLEKPWDWAIAVPARNEAGRIAACLAALQRASERSGRTVGLVLAVNNTDDTTVSLAIQHLSRSGMPHVVIDVHFADTEANAGHARRLALDIATEVTREGGFLATTDADSLVDTDWLTDAQRLLESRADLICGAILPLDDERETLPPGFGERCAPEGEYAAMSVELAARLDPRPHDPAPAHGNIGGANLSFSRSLYRAVGGMPRLHCGEDRAFVALADQLDYRVAYAQKVTVRTSCRLNGRARGGMSDALLARIHEDDPYCDELLLDAETAAWTFWLRGRMRSAANGDRDIMLRDLGISLDDLQRGPAEPFGILWDRIRIAAGLFPSQRLRMSDVRRNCPAMRTMLERLRTGDCPGDSVGETRRWILSCLPLETRP
ncbi:glycosyltransferase [Rhodobacterales bacterium]|nr:glycosyltransferase [Rhodobacterales bacterium]